MAGVAAAGAVAGSAVLVSQATPAAAASDFIVDVAGYYL